MADDNVTHIGDGEIGKTAAMLKDDLQKLSNSYAGSINNAEAIGALVAGIGYLHELPGRRLSSEDVDEFTRRRIDDDGEPPDYGLLLDIRGYRIGDQNRVRWQVIPVESTANIDVEDGEYLAEVLEKVIEVLRTGATHVEPQ